MDTKQIVVKDKQKTKRRSMSKNIQDAEVVQAAETKTKRIQKQNYSSANLTDLKNFVVVNINGNQEVVFEGMSLSVPMVDGEALKFEEVLMSVNGDEVKFGKPFVSGAYVEAKKVTDYQGEKVQTMVYKAKSRYRRIRGSRPSLTRLEVTKVVY